MRFAAYAFLSVMAGMGAVGYAYATRLQFYPATVFLVTSKFCIVIMSNMCLLLTVLLGKFLKGMFFGKLRDAEVDLVWDNSRYAITETCLALTIFREELNLRVAIMFTGLLFSKIFHWLCDSRVEYMEHTDGMSKMAHFRISLLLIALFSADIFFSASCLFTTVEKGPSVQILFGFEYVILLISVASMFLRYTLSLIDQFIFRAGRWYNRSIYELWVRLGSDSFSFVAYIFFFFTVLTYYGLPLNMLRQVYMSFRSLHNRLMHFLRFRRITHNIHERFPTATESQLEESDKLCIICRDEMSHSETGMGAPKVLKCGHIFHCHCLRNWLERQLTCPTCRDEIQATAPAPAPANVENDGNDNQPPQNDRPGQQQQHRRRRPVEEEAPSDGGTQRMNRDEDDESSAVHSNPASSSGPSSSSNRSSRPAVHPLVARLEAEAKARARLQAGASSPPDETATVEEEEKEERIETAAASSAAHSHSSLPPCLVPLPLPDASEAAPAKASLAHVQQQVELLQLHLELVEAQLAVTRGHSAALVRTLQAHVAESSPARSIRAIVDHPPNADTSSSSLRRRRPHAIGQDRDQNQD